ncbi:uncharacterized protein LOC131849721 [Achroia grisella]|uniref:uncharacterized protein LOC131849721 n=1 Tax=Achroia grisella TaxID=688607 RepID=UPI0027D2E107|nr:uncharacterized protein LOC131849721 [Achroia grisella]
MSYLIVTVSSQNGFHFTKAPSMFGRSDDADCKLCYGQDCVIMDESSKCNYYSLAANLLNDDGDTNNDDNHNPTLRDAVDSMMFDFIEKESSSSIHQCVPFISRYTDCHKDNICLGCTECSCDEDGKWDCGSVQRCQSDDIINIDHRVLMMTVENIRKGNKVSNRLIRSVTQAQSQEIVEGNNKRKLTFEELLDWFYGVQPLQVSKETKDSKKDMWTENVALPINKDFSQINSNYVDSIVTPDADYLEFEEVLRSINKPIYKSPHIGNSISHEYTKANEENRTNIELLINEPYLNITNAIKNGEDNKTSVEVATENVIDLLASVQKRLPDNLIDKLNNSINENLTEMGDFNVINIMKRDIPQANVTETTVEDNNKTDKIQDLKENVLFPLSSIVNDKQDELKELIRIKDSLLQFIKVLDNDTLLDYKENKTTTNKTYMSFYKFNIFPQYDLRSEEKYMHKLKHDILEVIKDMITIQKLPKSSNLPKDLKGLFRAMKYYIHKNGKEHIEINKNETEFTIDRNSRRHSRKYGMSGKTSKDFVIEMIQLIDNEMPYTVALDTLSQKSRKLLSRIITQYNFVEFAFTGLRVDDPIYNLTNDLLKVGTKYENLIETIGNSSQFDRIYNMKLLYITLYQDVIKINDALKLIDFAQSRRMIPSNIDIAYKILIRINNDLHGLKTKVRRIIRNQNTIKTNVYNRTASKKKESFLKRIKKLFRNSKDVLGLLHKNRPKSEIVRELAKKKLDDLNRRTLNEYEDTTLRWPNSLDAERKRRSIFDFQKLKNRCMNILPQYLRGKISPAIDKRKIKKKNNNTRHSKLDRNNTN